MIYICYYGESKDDKYKEYSNFYFKRKGSKIQNFYYLWNYILKSDNKIKEYENYYPLSHRKSNHLQISVR